MRFLSNLLGQKSKGDSIFSGNAFITGNGVMETDDTQTKISGASWFEIDRGDIGKLHVESTEKQNNLSLEDGKITITGRGSFSMKVIEADGHNSFEKSDLQSWNLEEDGHETKPFSYARDSGAQSIGAHGGIPQLREIMHSYYKTVYGSGGHAYYKDRWQQAVENATSILEKKDPDVMGVATAELITIYRKLTLLAEVKAEHFRELYPRESKSFRGDKLEGWMEENWEIATDPKRLDALITSYLKGDSHSASGQLEPRRER